MKAMQSYHILTTLLLLLCCIGCTLGYKAYQLRIPNGDRVTNPCDGSVWQGVGHVNKHGGGERNPFGKAFAKAGKKWTVDLCKADSDGDGISNGEELGDPKCEWKVGAGILRISNISHPGVCEPMDSPRCNNQTIQCTKAWSCPATKQPDVKSLKILKPFTTVPAQETTYLCYNKKVPSDRVYDIVASKSIISNENVNHHMTMYGCDGDIPDDDMDDTVDECQLRNKHCSKMLHIWSVGMEPFCQPDYKAFRFGKGLTTWVSIQFHWNNPQKIANYTDQSGVEIFYTPKLRKYAEDIVQTGDGSIFIPPNSKDFKVKGLCSNYCSTKSFEKPFNISSILLHMHGTGTRMWAKHYRSGKLLRLLAEDKPYHYNRPVIHRFEDPIEFRPGDELMVECTFDTSGNDKWVINGPGTQDEMCLTLISYYPANEFRVSNCFSVTERCGKADEDFAPGCHTYELYKTVKLFLDDILTQCDITDGLTCPKSCAGVIDWIKYQNINCFDHQPKGVERFMWASVIPSMIEDEAKSHQITKAFKGCELYDMDRSPAGFNLPAM